MAYDVIIVLRKAKLKIILNFNYSSFCLGC